MLSSLSQLNSPQKRDSYFKKRVILTAMVAIFIAIVTTWFTLNIEEKIQNTNTTWQAYNQETSTKSQALNYIQQSFGYGGFIHHFKNYVLRQNDILIPRIQISLSETLTAIEIYKATQLTLEEQKALNDIERVVTHYAQSFALAQQLTKNGLSPEEIDIQVKVDDTPALQAFALLNKQLMGQTSARMQQTQEQINKTIDFLFWLWLLLPALFFASAAMILFLKTIVNSHKTLQETGDILSDLFEAAPDAMLLINKRGIITKANSQAELLLGYNKRDIPGMHIEQIMPERYRGTHAMSFEKSFDNPHPRNFHQNIDFYGYTKNGEEIPLDIGISFTTQDSELYAITTLRDISFHKNAERELKASKAMFTKAQHIAQFGSWDWDMSTDKILWSEEVYRIFGRSDHEFEPTYDHFLQCLHPDDRESVVNAVNETVIYNKPYKIEHRILWPTGEERIIQQQGDFFRGKTANTGHMVGTIVDITEHRQAERELQIADNVFSHTADAIIVTDATNKIIRVNEAFTRITGYDPSDVIGDTPHLLFLSQKGKKQPYEKVWQYLAIHDYWQGEIIATRKNGENYPCRQHVRAVKNPQGQTIQFISIFSDITKEKEVEEKLKKLAQFDQLTELPNRTLFNDRLQHAIVRCQRSKKNVGLLFIDLDGFKGVNDMLGHYAGDKLLQVVASRLKSSVRAQDTIARLGGDEFTIILEELSQPEDAAIVAQKVISILSMPIQLEEDEVFIGGSIGISVFPNDADNTAGLIKNADMAMYQAKKQGRGRYVFYTEDLAHTAQERFQLEHKLRQAIEQEQLEVYYQPQIDWRIGKTIGAEALVRWNDPERGVIPPAAFIPLAEETGLIEQIGNWVLEHACRQAKVWQEKGLPPLRISVNVAGQQITRNSIVDSTKSVLKKTGLAPQFLELEITEGFVMQYPEQGIATLNALRELGVTLAIDDFGTGYSSLSYLKRLSVDRLKIDRSFVMDIPQDKDDEAITLAIISMTRSLGLSVIAEGVETIEHIEFLSQHGCSEMQGYYFSPPVPHDKFEDLYSHNDFFSPSPTPPAPTKTSKKETVIP